jgi:hypothetical protein
MCRARVSRARVSRAVIRALARVAVPVARHRISHWQRHIYPPLCRFVRLGDAGGGHLGDAGQLQASRGRVCASAPGVTVLLAGLPACLTCTPAACMPSVCVPCLCVCSPQRTPNTLVHSLRRGSALSELFRSFSNGASLSEMQCAATCEYGRWIPPNWCICTSFLSPPTLLMALLAPPSSHRSPFSSIPPFSPSPLLHDRTGHHGLLRSRA